MKLIIYFVVVLFLISCNRSEDSKIGLREVDFSVEEYFIDSENKLSQFYYFNQVKNDSLLVFNVFSHSLEIIDLKEKERMSPFKFEFNGLNAVNGVRSFYYHNKDSIFFSEDNLSIALMSSEGELIDRYSNLENSLSFLDSEKVYRNMPSMEFSSQLLYNSINKEIIIYHQTFNQKDKKSIFSTYSIKSRKSKILPTYYPEEYLNQKLDLNKLFLTSAILNQGYLVYIFSGSPKITSYDFNSDKVTIKSHLQYGNSKLVSEMVPFGEISYEEKQRFMMDNPFYYKIYFDETRKLYLTLSSPPRPGSTEEDFHYVNYNTILVSIFDEDMNQLSSFFLPKKNIYNVGFSFVFSEGLWISYNSKNQDDESYIKGDLIRFNVID